MKKKDEKRDIHEKRDISGSSVSSLFSYCFFYSQDFNQTEIEGGIFPRLKKKKIMI